MTTETESAPAEAQKPASQAKHVYTPPDEAGRITRDGVFICRYIDGVLLWESEEFKAQFTAPVHKGLKAQGKEVKVAIVSPLPPPQAVTSDQAPYGAPPPSQPVVTVVPDGLTPEQRRAILRLRRSAGFPDEVEKRTRKPVKPDKLIGRKSEAYVMDLLRYEPVKFAETYGLVGIGKIRRVEKKIDPETKVEKKVERIVECVLSRSKTHLTERANDDAVVEVEEDGNE